MRLVLQWWFARLAPELRFGVLESSQSVHVNCDDSSGLCADSILAAATLKFLRVIQRTCRSSGLSF